MIDDIPPPSPAVTVSSKSVASPLVAPPVAPPALHVAPAAAVAEAKPAPAAPARTAIQEREAARRSLERGKTRDAIAAAERSVALDGTDAEAWLILGAAKQEIGHGGEALSAFRSCAKSAKRGPVRECRAMLR